VGESRSTAASSQPATRNGRSRAKVIVVMPAMNAAATLRRTFDSIPLECVDEVILVDDHSTDETVDLARTLPVHVVWHPHNAGYGANQKTCYLEALQRGADVVVMLHPDGQYEPGLIPSMIEPILAGRADLVLGSRLGRPGMALRNGMPRWKYVANRALTIIENKVMGTHLTEAHTGYRAYSRKLLLTVPFLRNSLDFAFDSEMIMQAVHFHLRIEEVPAAGRYFDDASSVRFRAGVIYGAKTIWAAVRLVMHRSRIVPSKKFKNPGQFTNPGRHPPPVSHTNAETSPTSQPAVREDAASSR
jgi:glycosyltransferase involved in cell wall biosynthesis